MQGELWSIPKGLVNAEEDNLEAAQREFAEETSIPASAPFIDLGEIRQKSGKRVLAWAFLGSDDLPEIRSNLFTLEWPPRSGQKKEFPEIDKGEFFSLEAARTKIRGFILKRNSWIGCKLIWRGRVVAGKGGE